MNATCYLESLTYFPVWQLTCKLEVLESGVVYSKKNVKRILSNHWICVVCIPGYFHPKVKSDHKICFENYGVHINSSLQWWEWTYSRIICCILKNRYSYRVGGFNLMSIHMYVRPGIWGPRLFFARPFPLVQSRRLNLPLTESTAGIHGSWSVMMTLKFTTIRRWHSLMCMPTGKSRPK